MNKNDLKQKLISSNIPKETYSLEGGLPNEAYCINQIDDKWEVYYSERGQKSGLKIFDTEEEACEYFYNELIEMLKDMGIL
jgi:hypothetical protein